MIRKSGNRFSEKIMLNQKASLARRAMDFVLPGAQTESGWGEWLDELGQRRAPHVAQ
jgi:hypothetical protein